MRARPGTTGGARVVVPPVTHDGQHGFTLLEILVVMVIIGVLASLVSLSVSSRAVDDRLQAESRRVEQLLRLASDEAQAKGLEIGFRQTTEGFEFLAPDAGGARWDVIRDGLFRPRQIAEPFYLELRVDGRLMKPAAPAPAPKRKDRADAEQDEDEDRSAAPSSTRPAAREQDRDRLEPQVLILSSGEITPFTLDLRLRDTPLAYRVEGSTLGEFSSARLDLKERRG